MSGLTIAQASADASGGRPVYWLPTFAQAAAVLREHLRQGDVCMILGAGDVPELGAMLVER